jgi:hypothetical protein
VPEAAPTRSASDREGSAVSSGGLGLVALTVLLLVAAGAAWAYQALIHYERRGVAHLPPDADLVARIDLEQVALFEPVRRHLLPLIDDVRLRHSGAAEPARRGKPRLGWLREQSGVNLAADLRELSVAYMAPTRQWVLVLGGLFPHRGVVPAIERSLRAEGATDMTRAADVLVFEPSGVALGQAPDGVLIVASSRARLEQALPAKSPSEAAGATGKGDLEFVVGADLLRGFLAPVVAFPLEAVGQLVVRGQLGDAIALEGWIQTTSPTALASVRSWLEQHLQSPAETSFVPSADWGGERAVAARTRLEGTEENAIILSSSWRHDEFEQGLRSLASWLQRWLEAADPAAF